MFSFFTDERGKPTMKRHSSICRHVIRLFGICAGEKRNKQKYPKYGPYGVRVVQQTDMKEAVKMRSSFLNVVVSLYDEEANGATRRKSAFSTRRFRRGTYYSYMGFSHSITCVGNKQPGNRQKLGVKRKRLD